MIRIAAVGDVHLGIESGGLLRPPLAGLERHADVLLLAGDLTRHGTMDEAAVVATELSNLPVPVVAVLGNHEYHSDQAASIAELLTTYGLTVLEGDGVVLPLRGGALGVAGVKGFGGGFAGKCGSAFGEPEMKAFIGHTVERSAQLREALTGLAADARVALTHYSPVPDTVRGEPPEIYPFLGSYLLADAIDAGGADLAVHGHAHFGQEEGNTERGTPVRNVAQPVIGAAYSVYSIEL